VIDNPQEPVFELYKKLKDNLESTNDPFEVVFVDNGNNDFVKQELAEIVDTESSTKVIRLRANSGDAAAFDAGLRYSDGGRVVFLSNRKRIDPAGIAAMIEKINDGFDLVVGWRSNRVDSKLNQVVSRGFNWLVKKFYRLRIHDINSGIFVAKREIFQEVEIYGDMNIFLPVLASRKGYKVGESKIEQIDGPFDQSKFISEYIQRLLDVITVIFLMNYSKRPLHFLGFIGFIFTLAGGLMNLYLFVYRVLGIGGIAGRPLLLLGALLLIIGVQMISIGLIGEIIIFTHARELKEYSIEEILE
jgi:glycosyltransferase involved in cell wall biosynthesis